MIKMEKIVFIGVSNKKDKEPFDISTNSGKIIHDIIKELNYDCYKLNLVPYVPLTKEGKLRYPTKEEIKESMPLLKKELREINPNCIISLGNVVSKELKKIKEYQNIILFENHPSYIYVYKRKELDEYKKRIIEKIKKKVGE